ncbi:magnesium transporter [Colwellia chukchiensis]|uniref:Magnesium transporter MgtE n=1 Tax=Colwellia chukchiensis TaxID=641665 RepID=A0A1H7MSK9_9GAMM|nr:magnesium transporter [Colwellia chukchiensis]SEL13788.1 magnesium transporter [Colwellia chukchiensis]
MSPNQAFQRALMPDAQSSKAAIHEFIALAHAVDVAAFIERLEPVQALQHLRSLDLAKKTAVFAYLDLSSQVAFSNLLPHDELASVASLMASDKQVDLFNQLEPAKQQQLLQDLGEEQRNDIRRLSAYAEKTAGALMCCEYVTLAANLRAKEAIAQLRQEAPEKETIYRSYIIDSDRKLIGALRLHTLILAADDKPIMALMETDPVKVGLNDSQEAVAHVINRYDLTAVPVVDENDRLVGIVTHDDAADAMQQETTEDFHKTGTVEPLMQSVMKASMRLLYKKRIVWLALLIFGNLISGAGLALFEETILAYVALVFFLPLLIDSSGNAGSQSATLMVRAMATGDVVLSDWRKLILRELAIALALGLTMAALVFPVGLMRGGTEIATVVALTMILVVMVGSIVGLSLPFLLHKLKLDPATASGPLVTTIADAVGVIVYFSIATALLNI